MLKSLKLGELGIDKDPFVLPSDWRSEVLRSKVRNMLDIQKPYKHPQSLHDGQAVVCQEHQRLCFAAGEVKFLCYPYYLVSIVSTFVRVGLLARAEHASRSDARTDARTSTQTQCTEDSSEKRRLAVIINPGRRERR